MRRRRASDPAGLARLAAVIAVIAVVAALSGAIVSRWADQGYGVDRSASLSPGAARAPVPKGVAGRSASFDRSARSIDDPASIWVVVNKRRPLEPRRFSPRLSVVQGFQVASTAAPGLSELLAAAERRGLGLAIASGYRSFAVQQSVHARLAAEQGRATADTLSARAGYSEHQTGLAVDLYQPSNVACELEACFGETPGGRWLAANSWRFGFVVRYTVANQGVTGYSPEPWHLRFVGRALAAELHRTGATSLEQFFMVRGGDDPR